MTRHRFPPAAISLAVALALLAACGSSEPPGSAEVSDGKPAPAVRDPIAVGREAGLDVLLITIDTLRADAVGAYGNRRGATPWMDRLATAGVRFEQARAHNVVTLPSHATVLSGLLPYAHGVRDNSGFLFPENLETLATRLRAAGYRTGAFISAFPLDSRFGLERGFEVYEDSFVGTGKRQAFLEQERPGRVTVELASRWLAEEDDRPTFAWVHLYEPHYPYDPPEPFASRFRDDLYLGEVAAVDAAIAPLLEPILAAGNAGQTLVILTSDHGEALGEHGEATHGIFGYESALRVPLILYQPRLLPPRVVAEPAGLVDLAPTILDLLALPALAGASGHSLLVPDGSGVTYFEALSGQLNRGWAPLYGTIRNRWKLIDLPIVELYDLVADPLERENLAEREPQRVASMGVLLAELRALDAGATREPVSAEVRERLASLGYLTADAPARTSYDVADDPKRLIPLDNVLRNVAGLHAAGDLAAARAQCRELIERRPNMRIAHLYLAQIERDLGNLGATIEALETAFTLYPEDAATLTLLASSLTQAGRPQVAAEITAPHSRLPRPDPDVLLTRSLALARTERADEAFEMVELARESDPDNPLVAVYSGTLHLMAARRGEARAAYQRALELNPDTVQALTALAIMATEENRTADALEYWRRAVELDPREHAKLLSIAGRLWTAGQRESARPLLELFVDSAPRQPFTAEIERVQGMLASSGS